MLAQIVALATVRVAHTRVNDLSGFGGIILPPTEATVAA